MKRSIFQGALQVSRILYNSYNARRIYLNRCTQHLKSAVILTNYAQGITDLELTLYQRSYNLLIPRLHEQVYSFSPREKESERIMDGAKDKDEESSTNESENVHVENKTVQKEGTNNTTKEDILLKQQKDLAEYRKCQRDKWQKINSPHKENRSELPIKEILDTIRVKKGKKKKEKRSLKLSPTDNNHEHLSRKNDKDDSPKRERKQFIGSDSHTCFLQEKGEQNRKRKNSDRGNTENKRLSLENGQKHQEKIQPEIIDLESDCISNAPFSVRNGDILEIQDMELESSNDEEEIVLLAPSPQPGTSSEGQSADKRDRCGSEDDVMYMGTFINLSDSPTDPSPGPDSTSPRLRHSNPQHGNPHPMIFPSEQSSYLQWQQQQTFSSSNTSTGCTFSSSGSTFSHSAASSNSQTMSSSFESFMKAAALGNAIAPQHNTGLPASRYTWLQGYSQRRNPSPLYPVACSQPAASFHQGGGPSAAHSTCSQTGRRSASPIRESHKSKRSKLRNRKWVLVDEQRPEADDLLDFTVISYNVLAQNLIESNRFLYRGSKKAHLDWHYRSSNLLDEIKQYRPDVLCLQEVKADHYDKFFKPKLESLGYSGRYKKRTRDMQDGCATFFKRCKFQLDVAKPLEYLTRKDDILDRDNVALIVRLTPTDKSTDRKLVVANTHLLFNPRRGDVKLAQSMLLLTEVDRLAHIDDPGNNPFCPRYHPTVITGDFNSQPMSELYGLFASGVVDYGGKSVAHFSGQRTGREGGWRSFSHQVITKRLMITDFCQHVEDVRQRHSSWRTSEACDRQNTATWGSRDAPRLDYETLLTQQTGTVRTFLRLNSVYKHHTFSLARQRLEKEVTTHHGEDQCTVDYIFYTAGSRAAQQDKCLRLVRRLELLTAVEMNQLGPLPNKDVSSDHLLLGAAFQLEL